MDLSNFTTDELQALKQANTTGDLSGLSTNTLLKLKNLNNGNLSVTDQPSIGTKILSNLKEQLPPAILHGLANTALTPAFGPALFDAKAAMQNPGDAAETGLRNFAQAISFGAAPYLQAGGRMLDERMAGNPTNYSDALNYTFDRLKQGQQAFPGISSGAQTLGVVAPGSVFNRVASLYQGATPLKQALGNVATNVMFGQAELPPNAANDEILKRAGMDFGASALMPGMVKMADRASSKLIDASLRKSGVGDYVKENIGPTANINALINKNKSVQQDSYQQLQSFLEKDNSPVIDISKAVEIGPLVDQVQSALDSAVSPAQKIQAQQVKSIVEEAINNDGMISRAKANTLKAFAYDQRNAYTKAQTPGSSDAAAGWRQAGGNLAGQIEDASGPYSQFVHDLNQKYGLGAKVDRAANFRKNASPVGLQGYTSALGLLLGGLHKIPEIIGLNTLASVPGSTFIGGATRAANQLSQIPQIQQSLSQILQSIQNGDFSNYNRESIQQKMME